VVKWVTLCCTSIEDYYNGCIEFESNDRYIVYEKNSERRWFVTLLAYRIYFPVGGEKDGLCFNGLNTPKCKILYTGAISIKKTGGA